MSPAARFALVWLLSACATEEATVAHYRAQPQRESHKQARLELNVVLDPARHHVKGHATLTWPSARDEFYLNKDFVVHSVHTVDGKWIAFQRDQDGASPAYTSAAKPVRFEGATTGIVVAYSGYIQGAISDVNMVTPNLVELASYAAWYPFTLDDDGKREMFDYSLALSLPQSFTLATNGRAVRTSHQMGRLTHEIRAHSSTDLAIVASPHLRTASIENPLIEMYHSERAIPVVAGKDEIMHEAADELTRRFGTPRSGSAIRFVYSPRAGWGYARAPLFVVSEQWALKRVALPFGHEEEVKGNVHELAHFWWSIASTASNDDWIDEGLAEYTALSFVASKYGHAAAQHLLRIYANDIRGAQTDAPIINTPARSADKFIKRYEKVALLLYAVESSDKSSTDRLLATLHSRFKDGSNATSAEFLTLADAHLRPSTAQILREALTAPGWSEDMLRRVAQLGDFNVLREAAPSAK